MRIIRLIIIALIGAIAVAACSDTPDSIDDALTSLPSDEDVAEVGADIQAQVDAVATEIENSEAADELAAGWADVQTEISAAIGAISANEEVDADAIREQLDEFQADLEAAGDEVGTELMNAWEELRSSFEAILG